MVILYYLDPLLITHQYGKQNKNAVPKAMSGSLPRIWKKESAVSLIVTSVGSPPRVWGKGQSLRSNSFQLQDHPHACGEKSPFLISTVEAVGSPPTCVGKSFSLISGMHTKTGSPPRMWGKGIVTGLFAP